MQKLTQARREQWAIDFYAPLDQVDLIVDGTPD